MPNKILSAVLLVLAAPLLVRAQDKIYKRDGSITEAKVKAVGLKLINYVKFDNQSGPEYTIPKNDVEKIIYQGGGEDKFPADRTSRSAGDTRDNATNGKTLYGSNIIAIAPVQFTESGLGAALSYERVLDKKGLLAFYLPLVAAFRLNDNDYNSSGLQTERHTDMTFYAMPGLKIYPTGSFGVVRYGVGPSVVVANGERSEVTYDLNGYPMLTTKSRFMLGMILNNSLNVNPSQHIYMGFEFGLGFTYLHQVDGITQNTKALVQGGFKIGYRF